MLRQKRVKQAILIIVDFLLIMLAYFIAIIFRFYFGNKSQINIFIYYKDFLPQIIIAAILYIVVLSICKQYVNIWSIAGVEEFALGTSAVVTGCLINIVISLLENRRLSLMITLISAVLIVLLCNGIRVVWALATRTLNSINREKPGLSEMIDGKFTVDKIRDVDVKDLLGREEVNLDKSDIANYIEDKVVLVTGGGGSIGSELCRQIVSFKPKQLIIVDIYENNAYEIQNELLRKYKDLNLITLIASVRDKNRMDVIFRDYKPQVVFHAAAHKHVPLMEESPGEAIKNNVLGTLNTVDVASKYNVERFVLISTDKAVNPTNIMGATKRLCEMIIQAIDKESKTEFVAVRFGNVLGSNGSVVPLFKKQIAEGGPVTITHKDITRYFMLIKEASQLVLQAGAYGKGGEIFVLDMGEPIKIYDLAENLIKLSGYEVDKDIKIEIIGLRPGEKLYEELLMSEEGLIETNHKMIFIGKPGDFDLSSIREVVLELMYLVTLDDVNLIKSKLKEIVTTYVETSDLPKE